MASFQTDLVFKAFDGVTRTVKKIQGSVGGLQNKVKRVNNNFRQFQKRTESSTKALTRFGDSARAIGGNMTKFITLPVAAAGALSVKTFIDVEKGLIGVKKTTGIAGKELERLSRNFTKISKEIPVSKAEMLELAQAAGQLGVKGADNIEKFTLNMAKLATASDVAGEDGAKAISRILTVTGDGVQKVDKFSAALVDLGNNAAASESEILEVANRVAGNIGRFGAGSDAVLGISTALKSLGKRAEASGSVIGRSFESINQAIRGGGTELKILERLTGLTGKQLEKTFKEDSTKVFQLFIQGLSQAQKQGVNVTKVMEGMGLKGVRINDVLGTLVNKVGVLDENLERSGKAFKENTALNEEFEQATKSLGAELTRMKNTVFAAFETIGKKLAPAVRQMSEAFRAVIGFLQRNPTFAMLLGILAGIAAVLGPLILALGVLAGSVVAVSTAMGILSAASLPITGTVLLIGAAIAALIAVVALLIDNWDFLMEKGKQLALFLKDKFFGAIDSIKEKFNELIGLLPDFIKTKIGIETEGPTAGPGPASAIPEAQGTAAALGGPQIFRQTNDARVNVRFDQLPAGSQVRSEGGDGMLDLSLGFAGVN